jgi:hypothetical protein
LDFGSGYFGFQFSQITVAYNYIHWQFGIALKRFPFLAMGDNGFGLALNLSHPGFLASLVFTILYQMIDNQEAGLWQSMKLEQVTVNPQRCI